MALQRPAGGSACGAALKAPPWKKSGPVPIRAPPSIGPRPGRVAWVMKACKYSMAAGSNLLPAYTSPPIKGLAYTTGHASLFMNAGKRKAFCKFAPAMPSIKVKDFGYCHISKGVVSFSYKGGVKRIASTLATKANAVSMACCPQRHMETVLLVVVPWLVRGGVANFPSLEQKVAISHAPKPPGAWGKPSAGLVSHGCQYAPVFRQSRNGNQLAAMANENKMPLRGVPGNVERCIARGGWGDYVSVFHLSNPAFGNAPTTISGSLQTARRYVDVCPMPFFLVRIRAKPGFFSWNGGRQVHGRKNCHETWHFLSILLVLSHMAVFQYFSRCQSQNPCIMVISANSEKNLDLLLFIPLFMGKQRDESERTNFSPTGSA